MESGVFISLGWGTRLYLIPFENLDGDAMEMVGVDLMTGQLHDDKAIPFEEHSDRPHIINLKRKLSLASSNSSRRLSNNFKRSLSFMARHTQDVASPQFSTKQTIISPPRSSRSPSLSFVPPVRSKSKLQVIRKRSQSSISTLTQTTSPRNSPPPDFLLDDDPFANLTGFGGVCRQLSAKATGEDVKYSRRSRLVSNGHNFEPLPELDDASSSSPAVFAKSPETTPQSLPFPITPPANFSGSREISFPSIDSLNNSAGWSSTTSLPQPSAIPQRQRPLNPQPAIPQVQQQPLYSPPSIPRPLHHPSLSSSTSLPLPHRPSPAHQRPAFKSRPSLPSLNTLAKMNFVPGFGVKKVRKGKVGAGLPFEPWNDLGSRPSSGETSSVEEEDETVVGTGTGPATPLPSLISVIESASTSEHESGDSKTSSPTSPTRSSPFSVLPSSSSTSSHSGAYMLPHSVSVAPTSIGLDAEVGVLGDSDRTLRSPPRSPPASSAAPQVSLPSSSFASSSHTGTDSVSVVTTSLGLDSEAVYGDFDGSGKLGSSLRSPPAMLAAPTSLEALSSVPLLSKLIFSSSILSGDPMSPSNAAVDSKHSTPISFQRDIVSHGRDANKISSSSPKETLEVGLRSPNLISAFRHDDYDDDDVHVYEDDDADQFMDQFMEHYDRLDQEEDQLDDASRQDQEGPSQEEDNNDVMVSLGERVVVEENGDEIQMQLPPQLSSLSVATTAPAIPLVDAASVSSSETSSASPTFPRIDSLIFASDDSSTFDPYSYTYPYPSSLQNSENDAVPSVGNVVPRAVVDKSGDEIPLPLTITPSIPLVDAASVSSSETLRTSATLSAFSRSSSPILVSAFDEKGGKRTAELQREERRKLSSYLATSSSSSTSSSNDDDEDDYHGPVNSSPSQSHHSRTTSSISITPPGYTTPPPRTLAVSRNNGSRFFENDADDVDDDDEEEDEEDEDDDDDDDDDDDVPLAKRIPGALTAQKSIRRQVRQEREKKKEEKALRSHAESTRSRSTTLRPGAVPSGSHDTATASQITTQRISKTLTRNNSRSLNPFSREASLRKKDINGSDGVDAAVTTPVDPTSLHQRLNSLHRSKSMTRTLRDVHPSTIEPMPPVPFPQSRPSSSQAQRAKSVKEPYRFPTSPSPTPINSTYAPSSMTTLRPKRSFHFHRPSVDSRPIGMDDPRSVPLPLDAEKRISQNSANIIRSRPSTREGPHIQSFPTATPTHHHNRSHSRSRGSVERVSPTTFAEPVPPIPPTARISHDVDKHSKAPSRQHRPAPSSLADPLPVVKPELVVQQRVFIGSMQRFNMVEIGASTTAGDIIKMIEAEGSLKDFAVNGGWMVFEVAQDFGMERPIRSFELVADVQASWNKDKLVNYLVLRMTPLEIPLNRSAIPSSSPTHSGYIEWEAKRGKWSKRFLQLREHSIWISKHDTGQGQVQLCSLSNYDAYQVTRNHRAPKPFAFAVKSTDNLSYFENTADYFHSFACSEKEGKIWMEKILIARSYVLFQERHVLFNPKTAGGNVPSSVVSRSGTRKAVIQRPHHDVFEPGSLLSKQL